MLPGKNCFAVKYYFENAKELYFGFGKSEKFTPTEEGEVDFPLAECGGCARIRVTIQKRY